MSRLEDPEAAEDEQNGADGDELVDAVFAGAGA